MSSDKKRKSTVTASEPPSKRQQTAGTVVVKYVTASESALPVIATTPGISIPPNVKFQSFARKSRAGRTDILLQSSDHSTIDYIASDGGNSTEKHVKHYIAVFDPAANKLQVTEARNLTIRGCVRQMEPVRDDEDDESQNQPVTNYTARAALTHAFGTKKSKKAVQARAENRLLAHGEDADNPVSNAILFTMSKEDLEAATESNEPSRSIKPLPFADLTTNDVSQVYPLSSLVFPHPPEETLSKMPIQPWLELISSQTEVQSRFRFIANRIGYLAKSALSKPSDASLRTTIQLLRYFQLLLEISTFLRHQKRKQAIPPPSKWPENTIADSSVIPYSIINEILAHFLPDRVPNTHAVTLLHSTILAIALHIPPPSLSTGASVLVTEPTDLSLDLALDAAEVRKLYRELGCRHESATDAELAKWGLQKIVARGKASGLPKPKFAKLSFPIEFPKLSRPPLARAR